jgi:hypothetical protein
MFSSNMFTIISAKSHNCPPTSLHLTASSLASAAHRSNIKKFHFCPLPVGLCLKNKEQVSKLECSSPAEAAEEVVLTLDFLLLGVFAAGVILLDGAGKGAVGGEGGDRLELWRLQFVLQEETVMVELRQRLVPLQRREILILFAVFAGQE